MLDAVPEAVPQAVTVEKDNRKELMNKLQTMSKSLTKGIKDFQSADKLKLAGSKADKVVRLLTSTLATAEVANKIMKINSDESDLNGKVRDLMTKAFELNKNIESIKQIESKILSTQDMHKSLNKVSKFLVAQKKAKGLPDKDKITNQMYSLEQVSEMSATMPSKQEIDQITEIDKQVKDIEKELDLLLGTKFVKPQTAQTAQTVL